MTAPFQEVRHQCGAHILMLQEEKFTSTKLPRAVLQPPYAGDSPTIQVIICATLPTELQLGDLFVVAAGIRTNLRFVVLHHL
jgi:hypothetical protein